ncbi:MAG TPA: protein kinase [Ktedonobacteraceae bacterium]|jgi:serine/threonine protein kinase|nr:protein kinase [Ktedonobacteraceae bacterium]
MATCCIKQHVNNTPGTIWCNQCSSLVEGALIADYRILSHIGSGTCGDVYLAEQQSLQRRKVVVKVLSCGHSKRSISSFQREATLLASLSHPYILPIFSYGCLEDRQGQSAVCMPYLVLPYASQGSLEDAFGREGRQPWTLSRVVPFIREVAEALDYAHSRGVLHRDVKPANILQMGSHVLLADFSVATLIDVDASHLSSPWAGSPAYMAPEVWQFHPGRYSDQYALAVTCFYLLTGEFPWAKSDGRPRNWTHLHCHVPPRPLRSLRPDIPQVVEVVLTRALEKDPHKRYPTAQTFASDLILAAQDETQQLPPLPQVQREVLASPSIKGCESPVAYPYGPVLLQSVTPQVVPVTAPSEPVTEQPRNRRENQPAIEQPVMSLKGQFKGSTSALKTIMQPGRWLFSAALLNALGCLALSATSWIMNGTTAAANTLLAVWPALLVGPLLALAFRRVIAHTLPWGLFWGAFFGLTDGLLSVLLSYTWVVLVSLVNLWHCPPWCQSGDGLTLAWRTAVALAPEALLPTILGVWIACIGGAIIGILYVRSSHNEFC